MSEEKNELKLPLVFDTPNNLMVSFITHAETPPVTVAVPAGARVVIQELGSKAFEKSDEPEPGTDKEKPC